jgi:hypothetical protein
MKFTHYSKGHIEGQHLYLVVHLQIPTDPVRILVLGKAPINASKKT